MFTGAQIVPYVCATPTPEPSGGNTPGYQCERAVNRRDRCQCNIASETKLYYRTTRSGCDRARLPPRCPIRSATTANPARDHAGQWLLQAVQRGHDAGRPGDQHHRPGLTVPYIVRVERGTMNRGIYDIAVLFDPSQPWTAGAPQAQWNGKVYYNFGASTGQPRRQTRAGHQTGPTKSSSSAATWWWQQHDRLARNSNRVLMSETVMMMKEHIVDTYGAIRFTHGNRLLGRLDRLEHERRRSTPACSTARQPLHLSRLRDDRMEVGDCVLLVEAYQKPQWSVDGRPHAGADQRPEGGDQRSSRPVGCHGWYNAFGSNGRAGNYFQTLVANADRRHRTLATVANNCELPAAPSTTRSRTRSARAASTATPGRGDLGPGAGDDARRETRDNVGVQYGLKALQAGAITRRGVRHAEREASAATTATWQGRRQSGGADDRRLRGARISPTASGDSSTRALSVTAGTLPRSPIIDLRGRRRGADIHMQWRSYSQRARLDAANGGHGNQVMCASQTADVWHGIGLR